MIAPQNKFHFFKTKEWSPYRMRYQNSFDAYVKPYKQRLSETQPPSNAQRSIGQISELNMLLAPEESYKSLLSQDDEITQYFESGMCPFSFFCSPREDLYGVRASLRKVRAIPLLLIVHKANFYLFNSYGSDNSWCSYILEGPCTKVSRTCKPCAGCSLYSCDWRWR
jgi:hypothetical protein